MGTKSTYHRFHEAGQAANVNTVGTYGMPEYSLFTSSKVLSIHHKIEITDTNERVVYRAQSKAISIHNKTDIYDVNGNAISHIERKVLSIHERHYVKMYNGISFELSNEIFHLIKDITNIEGLGWQLRGNILALNFQLFDETGRIVAVIGQKLLSIHDKYSIDIYQPDKEQIAVTILIALQHMIRDRENKSSAVSFDIE